MVLAGQFSDEEAAAVAELVREGGGEIVANVDETWTRPRVVAHPTTWDPTSIERAFTPEAPGGGTTAE